MAVIKDTISQDADRLEPHFNINVDGTPSFDPDFMARTLPSDLTQSQVDRVIDHIDHVGHVVDVIVARKSIAAAKDNAALNEVSTSIKMGQRLSYNTRWDRNGKRATSDGHREARGVVVSSLSMRTDSDRENTYSALEALASAMLD